MWHSSSSSWVLREIRREKPVASVVRSMFSHGSRWAIIGTDVTACIVAAPPSGSPATAATRAQSWRAARSVAMIMN